MPRHFHFQYSSRGDRAHLQPKQRSVARFQAITITDLRAIIPQSGRCNSIFAHHVGGPIADRVITVQDRHRGRIIHPVRPQVIHIPNLCNLRSRTPRTGRTLVKEYVREGGIHERRDIARVDEGNDVVAAGEYAGPEGDFALAKSVNGGRVAPDAVGGGAEGVLGDG